MATYIPGAKSYLPDFKPFTPDFKFLSNALDLRTNKYETNYKQLNDLYGRVVYSDLSRGDTNETRDQYANELAPRIEQIASMDLSLAQNVDAAKAVFLPFFENDLIVKDMVTTDQYRKELAYANRLLNSNDPDVRSKYWDVGIKAMEYQMKDFVDASPDKALQMPTPKYIQNVNLAKRAEEILKESGYGDMETIQWSPDGRYIITTTGGMQVAAPAYELLQSQLLTDPKVAQAYYADAYVQMRDYVDNSISQGMYDDADAAKRGWADLTISTVQEQLAFQLQTSQNEEQVAKENSEEWDAVSKMYGIGSGTPEEKAMADALNTYEGARKKSARYNSALEEAATPTTDTDALLNRAYNLMMQTNISGDLQSAALRYAEVTQRIEIDEDAYALANHKSSLRLSEMYQKYVYDKEIAEIEAGEGEGGSGDLMDDYFDASSGSTLSSEGIDMSDINYDHSKTSYEDIKNETSDNQKVAAAMYSNAIATLRGESGSSPIHRYKLYNEAGVLEVMELNQMDAQERLSDPRNAEILERLVRNLRDKVVKSDASGVELSSTNPTNTDAIYTELLYGEGWFDLSVEDRQALIQANSTNATYATAFKNPDLITGLVNTFDPIIDNYNSIEYEYDQLEDGVITNLTNRLATRNGADQLSEYLTENNKYLPSIFKGGYEWRKDGNTFVLTQGDLKVGEDMGFGPPEKAGQPEFYYKVETPTSVMLPKDFIEVYKNYIIRDLRRYNSRQLTSFNEHSHRGVVEIREGFVKPSGYEKRPPSEAHIEIPKDRLDSSFENLALDFYILEEPMRKAAMNLYNAQLNQADIGFNKAAGGNTGYTIPRNIKAVFSGDDPTKGESSFGMEYGATFDPRNPSDQGLLLMTELERILRSQDLQSEIKITAVGIDGDIVGSSKKLAAIKNNEVAANLVRNWLSPSLRALAGRPGEGKQTASDLWVNIEKAVGSTIDPESGEELITYTLTPNPQAYDQLKQTGLGLDLLGVKGAADDAAAIKLFTDYSQLQITLPAELSKKVFPGQIGDVRTNIPSYNILQSQGEYPNSIPHGGSYKFIKTSDPLAVRVQLSTVQIGADGKSYELVPSPDQIKIFRDEFEFDAFRENLNAELVNNAQRVNLEMSKIIQEQ